LGRTTKTEAVRELRRLKHLRDERETPIARSITMESVADMTFAALEARTRVGKGSLRTVSEYRRRWRIHLAPRIGRRKLNDVTMRTVLGLRDQLRADGLAESSVGSVLVVLRSMLSYAREAELTTFDPFRGLRRGRSPHRRNRPRRSVFSA
jgi:site-specific recombinase XerC